MPRFLTAGLTAFFIATTSLAHAQAPAAMPPKGGPTPQDLAALTDTRIELVKAALQMTPDEQKLWPPVEEAIRARARRISRDVNSLSELIERGTALKKLVDAWQPLYDSLDAR